MIEKQNNNIMQEELDMTLPKILFTLSAAEIAEGLKEAILEEESTEGESPLASAQTMLDFYINDTNNLITPEEKQHLIAVKKELHLLFSQE